RPPGGSRKRRVPRNSRVSEPPTPNQDVPLLGNHSRNRFLASVRVRWVSRKTKVSTTKALHPELTDAVSHLRTSDVLVIWKLDRLGRGVKRLVDFVAALRGRDVRSRSLPDGIAPTTPAGRFFFHVMASLAEMERELMAERTRAGLDAARRR